MFFRALVILVALVARMERCGLDDFLAAWPPGDEEKGRSLKTGRG